VLIEGKYAAQSCYSWLIWPVLEVWSGLLSTVFMDEVIEHSAVVFLISCIREHRKYRSIP
jgi:hypothetical protein